MMGDAIKWLEVQIKTWGNWNYLIALVTACIETFPILGIVVPGLNVMLLVGGFFGGQGEIQLLLMMACAIIGAILGNFFGYWLGVHYGADFLKKYGAYTVGIGPTEYKYLQSALDKQGFWFLVLGKFHGTTRSLIPLLAGATRMNAKRFWFLNILGSVVWAVSIILLGVVFAQYWEIMLEQSGWISVMIMGSIGGYIYFFQRKGFKKYWKEKQKELDT